MIFRDKEVINMEAVEKPRKKVIVLLGGSFNPPHKPHKMSAKLLVKGSSQMFIIPCGSRRCKSSINMVSNEHRMEMIETAFAGLEKTKLDLYDLENDVFTPTYLLQKRYEELFPDAEIWHAIGEDIIAGGFSGNSEIHRSWDHGHEIWDKLNFLIITRPGYGARPEDMPPSSKIIELEKIIGSGTLVRERIRNGESISDLVDYGVEQIIKRYRLYQ